MAPRIRIPFTKNSPTRQRTGTSLTASGAVSPSPTLGGESGSSISGRIFDPVPELTTQRQAIFTYTKMVRSDASVRVSLRAGKAPILGAEFFIDPYDESDESKLIHDFVDFNLFTGMTTPFLGVIEQVLKMYENGWSLFEPVYELREWGGSGKAGSAGRRGKYTMLRKLAVRPVGTVTDITYDDNGGPVQITQNAIRGNKEVQEVKLPIEKLLIFTFDKDGGDITGNSILRSTYEHWYYKDHLYKIDAIQKERHGIGIPDIMLQPGYSKSDKRIAHEIGRNLRTNERAYIVRNNMIEVGFAELSGNLVNALESAQHHDAQIMKNIMVQFLNMGIEAGSGGGRATGATSMDMFLKAMKYVANTICDTFNAYLIPNLVSYNFKTDQFPQLRVRNIGETKDLQMWASAMSNLKKQGLLQIDDETEQWIRKQIDAPKRTTPYKEAPTTQPSNGSGFGKPDTKVDIGTTGVSPSKG